MGHMSLLGWRIYWRFSRPVAQEVARLRVGGRWPFPAERGNGDADTQACIRVLMKRVSASVGFLRCISMMRMATSRIP